MVRPAREQIDLGESILGLFKTSDEAEALFDRPDQDRVRADLAEFFGQDGEAYLATYEKMRASTRRQHSVFAWSWPAFLVSFAWFFYRKQYVLGALIVLLPLVLGYLLGGSGGSSAAIVIAVLAKPSYVRAALERIVKADALKLEGAERADYLRRAGGVSPAAGGFAAIVLAGLVVLAFLPYMNMTGTRP